MVSFLEISRSINLLSSVQETAFACRTGLVPGAAVFFSAALPAWGFLLSGFAANDWTDRERAVRAKARMPKIFRTTGTSFKERTFGSY